MQIQTKKISENRHNDVNEWNFPKIDIELLKILNDVYTKEF